MGKVDFGKILQDEGYIGYADGEGNYVIEKPDYLILAEWMGEGESLKELVDKCHRIIEERGNPHGIISGILHDAARSGRIRESTVRKID